jgi:hypothetical protein
MLNSAEVRWFFPHKISADIKRWFLGPEYGGANPGPRADAYLVFPGCECLGVKQRGQEGGLKPKFEVKALRGAAETIPTECLAGQTAGSNGLAVAKLLATGSRRWSGNLTAGRPSRKPAGYASSKLQVVRSQKRRTG